MSSGIESPTPAGKPAKKPDLVSAPMTSVLVACVVAALGYSRGSELLTWQVPLGLVVLAVAYTAFRVMRSRG
jgi:hypothetical protein